MPSIASTVRQSLLESTNANYSLVDVLEVIKLSHVHEDTLWFHSVVQFLIYGSHLRYPALNLKRLFYFPNP